jgi:hypothetical protein
LYIIGNSTLFLTQFQTTFHSSKGGRGRKKEKKIEEEEKEKKMEEGKQKGRHAGRLYYECLSPHFTFE